MRRAVVALAVVARAVVALAVAALARSGGGWRAREQAAAAKTRTRTTQRMDEA